MNSAQSTKQSDSHRVDLAEARRAMLALLPHLPVPRLSEWMTLQGIRLENYDFLAEPNTLPILNVPGILLRELGPYSIRSLPKSWIPAHERNKRRSSRTTQLLRLHFACLRAESGDGEIPNLTQCDEVVAGLILLLLRPRLTKLRESLVHAATATPGSFGAYIAAHANLAEDENASVLESVASDSRLASTLCQHDHEAAGSLRKRLFALSDVWSATVTLDQPNAKQWLQRTVIKAEQDPSAAVSALTLQPGASVAVQDPWVATLSRSEPIFAYEVARWTKFTWEPPRWAKLCDRLRARATSDPRAFCLWYRDVEIEKSDDALREGSLHVLWAAELIGSTKNFGQALRRRMALRLKANSFNAEATLALRWLNQRGRPE